MQISSSDLQRVVFGEQYTVTEHDSSTEPTPCKRLKASSTNDESDEVSLPYGFLPLESEALERLVVGSSEMHAFFFQNRVSWSLNEFYDWLLEQIFQPAWEYRHGSVTAVRDLLKGQQSASITVRCATRRSGERVPVRFAAVSERVPLSMAGRLERASADADHPRSFRRLCFG